LEYLRIKRQVRRNVWNVSFGHEMRGPKDSGCLTDYRESIKKFWLSKEVKSFFFYYLYMHTRLGSFLPPAPTPSLTTHSAPPLPPPQYPAETILPLFLILL
jgi:hypothetical protein